jgi:hypothetical protein
MGVSGSSTSTGSFGKLLGEGGDITGITAPAITSIAGAAANQILTDDGDATVTSEANLTFDGTNLDMPDSIYARFGTGNDLQLYHDGSNSFIQQSGTGALKLATEDSGKAVSIGHTTSETTVNDNLTVTGNLASGPIEAAAFTLGSESQFREIVSGTTSGGGVRTNVSIHQITPSTSTGHYQAGACFLFVASRIGAPNDDTKNDGGAAIINLYNNNTDGSPEWRLNNVLEGDYGINPQANNGSGDSTNVHFEVSTGDIDFAYAIYQIVTPA